MLLLPLGCPLFFTLNLLWPLGPDATLDGNFVSLVHASDGGTGGRGEDGGSHRNSGRWLSTDYVSQDGVVGKTASSCLSAY